MSSVLKQEVLLLNKDFTVLGVTNVQQAFIYLVKGIAEVIDVDEDTGSWNYYDFTTWEELSVVTTQCENSNIVGKWLRRVEDNLLVPTVVRLVTMVKRNKIQPKFNRKNVYYRDNYTCQYCGVKKSTQELNLDHVLPSSRGGKTTWKNIVCSCIKCNLQKRNRTPEEANMHLLSEPKPLDYQTMGSRGKSSWKNFFKESDLATNAYWQTKLKD